MKTSCCYLGFTLSICCMSHALSAMQLNELPQELIYEITKKLDLKDFLRLGATCKRLSLLLTYERAPRQLSLAGKTKERAEEIIKQIAPKLGIASKDFATIMHQLRECGWSIYLPPVPLHRSHKFRGPPPPSLRPLPHSSSSSKKE